MKEINNYKTLAQKYNLANRSECIRKINELQRLEAELAYVVEGYRQNNELELAENYNSKLKNVSRHLNNLSILLGRDAEIRTKYLDELDRANYEEIKASYGAKFAYDEGKYDIQRKFLRDYDKASKQKQDMQTKLSSDEMYFEDEQDKENKSEVKNTKTTKSNITTEKNNKLVKKDDISVMKKIRIYVQAAFIAVGRTIKESIGKMKKSFNEANERRRQLAERTMRIEPPMDEQNIIKWTKAEEEAVRRMGDMNKNDEGIYMSDSPKKRYSDSIKLTIKPQPKEEEPKLEFTPFDLDKNQEDDDRDIG